MDPRLEDYVEIEFPELLSQYQECLVLLKDEVVAKKAWVKENKNRQARLWVEDLSHDKFFPSDIRVFTPKKNNSVEIIPPGNSQRYSRSEGTNSDWSNPPRTQEDGKSKNCPGGHGPQCIKVPTEDFSCDSCKFMLPVGSKIFSCRICDWDICADCAGETEEESYDVGEHVLVFYGPLLYDAIVVEIDPEDNEPYLVHFVGWNRRHDLWVPLPNMVKLNADTRLQQKELQEAEDMKKKRKRERAAKKQKTSTT